MENFDKIYRVKLDPCTELSVSMALFRKVKNCRTLREKVMSGSLKCVIIKPTLIADPFQVVVAANKAAISRQAGSLVTKSIYTEILYNLSISKNISQSLMKFGIQENDEDLLIVVLDRGESFSIEKVFSEIDGEIESIDQLYKISDIELICKSYKISGIEVKSVSLLDSIVSRIVTCDFVSH